MNRWLRNPIFAFVLIMISMILPMTVSAEESYIYHNSDLNFSIELTEEVVPHLTFAGEEVKGDSTLSFYYIDQSVDYSEVLLLTVKRWDREKWEQTYQQWADEQNYIMQRIHSEVKATEQYVYTYQTLLEHPYPQYAGSSNPPKAVSEYGEALNALKTALNNMEILPEKEWTNAPVEVSADKAWEVTFNTELDVQSVTKETIYIVDQEGNKVKGTEYRLTNANGQSTVKVSAPGPGYKPGTYQLYVEDNLKSSQSIALKAGVRQTFKVTDQNYFDERFVTLLNQGQLKHIPINVKEQLDKPYTDVSSELGIARDVVTYQGALLHSYEDFTFARANLGGDQFYGATYVLPDNRDYYLDDLKSWLGEPDSGNYDGIGPLYVYYQLDNGLRLEVNFTNSEDKNSPIQSLTLTE